jgi:hypothetical protein
MDGDTYAHREPHSAISGRAACHYCGPCDRGCVTHSCFNSAYTTVADAIASGNLTHIPNAMAFRS